MRSLRVPLVLLAGMSLVFSGCLGEGGPESSSQPAEQVPAQVTVVGAVKAIDDQTPHDGGVEIRLALDEGGYDMTEQDYNSLGGMGTWAAFVGFTQIAETIDGEITAESFFEAASNTSNLDLNGMVPVLDFTQEWTDGLEGYERLFNRSVVFSTLEDGKVVPLTTEFEDVGDLATGNAG